jgi:hypothetical protein
MRQGTVLILEDVDLLKSAADKNIEDITIFDFKLETKMIEHHGMIIYTPTRKNGYKIQKSRYSTVHDLS